MKGSSPTALRPGVNETAFRRGVDALQRRASSLAGDWRGSRPGNSGAVWRGPTQKCAASRNDPRRRLLPWGGTRDHAAALSERSTGCDCASMKARTLAAVSGQTRRDPPRKSRTNFQSFTAPLPKVLSAMPLRSRNASTSERSSVVLMTSHIGGTRPACQA